MWSPQPQLLLRFSTAGDGDLIAAMCARLSADEGSPRASRFSAEIFRRDGFGATPRFRCIIAELSGAPAGYVLHCPDYDTDHLCRCVYMADLYVEKTARGRGIGRALMAAAADDGRQRGAAVMVWTALRSNNNAREFYRRMGHENGDLIEYVAQAGQFRALAEEAEQRGGAFRLRPAQAGDCAAMAEFLSGLYRETGRTAPDGIAAILHRDGFGADPAFSAVIAESSDNVPIGYALYWPTYETESATAGGLLSDLYVMQRWRRHGVARGLLAAVVRHLARDGGSFLVWAVDSGNHAARAFYRTLSMEAPESVVCACDFQEFAQLADDARTWRR